MKAQAVLSFLVDGKWLNFFCRTMKELGSSFPSLVLTRFFALMHLNVSSNFLKSFPSYFTARNYKILVMVVLPMLIFYIFYPRSQDGQHARRFSCFTLVIYFDNSCSLENFQLSLIFLYFIAVSYQSYQIDFQNPGT